MVRGDHKPSLFLHRNIHQFPKTLIDDLAGFYRSREIAGVAHLGGIAKVGDPQPYFFNENFSPRRLVFWARPHLGFEVVGGDFLGGGNKNPSPTENFFFSPAVKKV